MKTCTKCQKEKPFSEFHLNSTKPDGHVSQCKSCCIAKSKANYHNNHNGQKDRLNIWAKTAVQVLRQIVNDIKAKYKCVFCEEDNPICLDFHHVNVDNKYDEIAMLVARKCKPKLIAEINKCVVLCSNCHRRVHAKQLEITTQPLCFERIEDHFRIVGKKVYFK